MLSLSERFERGSSAEGSKAGKNLMKKFFSEGAKATDEEVAKQAFKTAKLVLWNLAECKTLEGELSSAERELLKKKWGSLLGEMSEKYSYLEEMKALVQACRGGGVEFFWVEMERYLRKKFFDVFLSSVKRTTREELYRKEVFELKRSVVKPVSLQAVAEGSLVKWLSDRCRLAELLEEDEKLRQFLLRNRGSEEKASEKWCDATVGDLRLVLPASLELSERKAKKISLRLQEGSLSLLEWFDDLEIKASKEWKKIKNEKKAAATKKKKKEKKSRKERERRVGAISSSEKADYRCFNCRSPKHLAQNCDFPKGVCYKCGLEGHTQWKCQNPASCPRCAKSGKDANHQLQNCTSF